KGVYISYETGGIQTNSIWCPITEGDKKIDISAVPIEIKNFFTVSKDGETRVTYKRSDIEHLRFLDDDNISDSETFFAFSNRVK
ncbi:MAG: hypothetical protein RR630_09285, partial [Coprobacillus sp.]